jgi:hypothetical protein
MTGVSIPVMGAWVAASVMSKRDVFGGPFPVFLYLLLVGITVFVWGVMTNPMSPPTANRGRSLAGALVEEIALGAASFLVFWAVVGN